MKFFCSICNTNFEGERPICPNCGATLKYWDDPEHPEHDKYLYEHKGSYALGFILALCIPILGFIITRLIKRKKTQRGGKHGFFVYLGLMALLVVVAVIWYYVILPNS